ncbi:hypothetical protein [Cupriavidus necator]|uniref:hypothetical protein n=1 Tax=Cupriavidus necator TaxID=106590 RepID=UPI00339D8011
MQTIEIKGYVHARIYSWAPDKPEYQVFGSADVSCLNTESTTYTLVQEVTIGFEAPAIDYRTVRIAALEKEQAEIRAKLGKRIAEINDEISRLQAIEYTPAQEAA